MSSAKLGALLGFLAFFACPPLARATYSIVATDTATREVGGSGTSCLSGANVYIIYGSVPGVGVVHAQATYSDEVHDRSVELVARGLSPADAIAALTDETSDAEAQGRQFGVASVSGLTAGFTGSRASAYAGDCQGAVGTLHYSAQGNILTSAAVLSQAAAAFEAPGCDLAEHLMQALEAGGEYGEGDKRCTALRSIPSDSAFIQVDLPGKPAGSYLELHVPTANENPLPRLRWLFNTWRQTHPCPSAGSDAGRSPAAGDPAASAEASGCGCRAGRDPGHASLAWLALGVLALGRLRCWNPRRFQC